MPTISKLLVANRGEIAARVMRTARETGMATVAVFSDPDADAPFVREADEAVRLPGASPTDTYLRADLIVRAAQATGADAVHPGYGFLSENAAFARACADAGLVFVGPPAEAIEAMGSKLRAKALMAEAGVPILPGETVHPDDGHEALAAAAERIGFPVLVKAAYGGGGRGMRIVADADELAEAVRGARGEAASAFGDGTVFLERYLEAPRHVEVQVFGDSGGGVVHLFERECSIQRRHQKIIEESPSPAVDDAQREDMGAAAVAAAKAIGYVGAGTVEFLLDDGRFYFLEVNTRLQVEHPVTELVTGLDLVRLQLLVAEGHPLPDEVGEATQRGHAIEARLYAEDPLAGFLPTSGLLHRFRIPETPDVRVDAGVADGSVVGTHYDAMLAKVIARAPARDEACRRLADALARAEIHGVTTNRDLLVAILREDEFRAGRTDTAYLARHDPARLGAPSCDPLTLRLHAAAVALAGQGERRAAAPVLRTAPSGWRNNPSDLQRDAYLAKETQIEVGYRLYGGRTVVEVDGEPLPGVQILDAAADAVHLEVDGVRRRVGVHRAGGAVYVDSPLGSSVLTEVERFPDPEAARAVGSLHAPMPGTVVAVLIEPGDRVSAGQGLVVLEAMKMQHTVHAPDDGVVTEVRVSAGDQVDADAVLAVVGEDEKP
ncbi:MAG: ATP-grasp domain-containing protein [Streptosporangiales bacterium]|nr:ATP-grasp domain-containing protein [Streptosporangiales bacterium]